ncbi:MAG: sulfurtransferase TusA family protein [Alphaproteobacteria bacterium]
MPTATTQRVLDLRGLKCPLPVLRTRKAMRDVPAGEVVTVLADDPASVIDFPVFCHEAGLELVAERRDGAELAFDIRKPAGTAVA